MQTFFEGSKKNKPIQNKMITPFLLLHNIGCLFLRHLDGFAEIRLFREDIHKVTPFNCLHNKMSYTTHSL